MGLSNALSGGIIMFGITYVMFTFGSLTDTSVSFSYTSALVNDLENDLIKTTIDVAIEADPGTTDSFSFDLTNTGSTKQWDWEKFDVIVTYDLSNITYTETLSFFGTSCAAQTAGTWCINSWTNDALDPEILNNGETMTIDVKLTQGKQNGRDVIVVLATPNGVVARDVVPA